MTYLPLSDARAQTGPGTPSRLSAFAAAVAEYMHVFAAATRAARAVEARRSPRPADLKVLGITGKLPSAW